MAEREIIVKKPLPFRRGETVKINTDNLIEPTFLLIYDGKYNKLYFDPYKNSIIVSKSIGTK